MLSYVAQIEQKIMLRPLNIDTLLNWLVEVQFSLKFKIKLLFFANKMAFCLPILHIKENSIEFHFGLANQTILLSIVYMCFKDTRI